MDSSGLASTSAGHYGNGWITARAGGLGQNRGESRAEEQGLRTLASQKSCRLGIFSPNIALANHYLFSGQRLGRKMRIFDGSLRPGLFTGGPSGLIRNPRGMSVCTGPAVSSVSHSQRVSAESKYVQKRGPTGRHMQKGECSAARSALNLAPFLSRPYGRACLLPALWAWALLT